jgi:hypothetical protein
MKSRRAVRGAGLKGGPIFFRIAFADDKDNGSLRIVNAEERTLRKFDGGFIEISDLPNFV